MWIFSNRRRSKFKKRTERKRVRFKDEEEFIDRRRSSRIVASNEKKQQEKERKLTLISERNKNSTKKRCNKSQLISLFKAMQEGRYAHNNESTSMNASPQNNVPDKHVMENVIDFLQRKDQDDLFGEPVNPDTVENYHIIVKEPMDFGTMRAKVHEDMYTSLQQFKRDVLLLCFNAMNAYPETSRHHKVAEDIGCHAVNVFEDLNAQHEILNLDSSSNKERQSKKSHGRQKSASPKFMGGKVSETEKRLMYWPACNRSLNSEFITAPRLNIQLSSINYKDSLLRFVKDCGPIAQKVAAKKLEGLKFQQASNANNLNIVNKSLTIQDSESQQKRSINTISNVVDKNIFINNSYQAFATALMHTSVYDNAEKKINLFGAKISNENGNVSNNSCILNRNMVSKVDNVFNIIRQQNFPASNQNMPIVHPTSMISRPCENSFQS
ncbi:unnamed protein product [Trifolium pratense]|uniref:Uncharacterized protein n=1 Tax=Trifolium pratense TaxID=57577 RepID=A0ACB0J8J6_TRIPR|nr:unnamed protein product [Trifolium pratense]